MSSVLELQVYSLLSRLHAEQEDGCRKLAEAAAVQAAELVAEAHRRARGRVREAVAEKRRRVEEHCRQLRVNLELRRRDVRFGELGIRLAEGLARLPVALAARWSQAEERGAWCRNVLEGAGAVLPAGGWQILAAPGLTAVERDELAARAAVLAGHGVLIEERPELRSGIAVVRGGARYDGTLAGLMSDANRLHAALLAELGAVEKEQ